MKSKKEIGNLGEQQAVEFLIQNNFAILQQNYRYKRAEIDIIAQKDNCLHFIEVKTRKNNTFGFPEEFVSERKKELFIETAEIYIEENNWQHDIQFDIVSVSNDSNQIHFIEEAF